MTFPQKLMCRKILGSHFFATPRENGSGLASFYVDWRVGRNCIEMATSPAYSLFWKLRPLGRKSVFGGEPWWKPNK
jgi:hypothetical protein